MSTSPVAALFVRRDSVYKQMEEVYPYDIDANALTFPGFMPVVAHPPCRAWGQLRHLAKPRPGERDLAPWSVNQIRQWKGVLEHPYRSKLWQHCDLPEPGAGYDEWGGHTVAISQWWFGHLANKPTRLYIVGCPPCDLPDIPFRAGPPSHVLSYSHHCRSRPEAPRNWRERTPQALAEWLVEVARRCARINEPMMARL